MYFPPLNTIMFPLINNQFINYSCILCKKLKTLYLQQLKAFWSNYNSLITIFSVYNISINKKRKVNHVATVVLGHLESFKLDCLSNRIFFFLYSICSEAQHTLSYTFIRLFLQFQWNKFDYKCFLFSWHSS